MQTIKKQYLKLGVLFSLFTSNSALATDADEIFGKSNDKLKDFGEQLVLWSAGLCIVVWIGIGLLAMFGKFPKGWAAYAATGTAIIMASTSIAKFLMS